MCKEKKKREFDVIRSSPARNVHMRNRVTSTKSHDENFDLDTLKLVYNTPLIDKPERKVNV